MIVHGLKLGGTELREPEAMKELSIDMFGISKTNTNAIHKMRNELTKMIQQQLGGGVAVILSHRSTKIGYLPGGTTLITQRPTQRRYKRRIVDKMGRFSGQLLEGAQESGVFQCSVYRVCQTRNAIVGPDTTFARQHDNLKKQGAKNSDPRKQTLTDLTKLIQKFAPQGYHPMIMEDFYGNIDPKEMKAFMKENNLIDIIRDMHNGKPTARYARESQRIYFILGDQHVRDAATQSGYLVLHEGIISDHVMVWADFNQDSLFRNKAYSPITSEGRQFTLKNTEKKRLFVDKLEEIHEHQKIGQRVMKLVSDFKEEGKATSF